MVSLNGPVKCCAELLAVLNVFIGLAVMGYGLYVVFLPWGGVDRGTYIAVGVTLTLFGSALVAVSLFGYVAAVHQLTRYGQRYLLQDYSG
jgi:hypothetical protein